MPEATVLYSVTAAVIAGLFIWVATVLKSSKEPWARPRTEFLQPEQAADAPVADTDEEGPDPKAVTTGPVKEEDADESSATAEAEAPAAPSSKNEKKDVTEVLADVRSEEAKLDADSTEKATPVAKKSEGNLKAEEEKKAAKTEAAKIEAATTEAATDEDEDADAKKKA